MTSHPRRGAVVCVLTLVAMALATPALADDIELPPDVAGPVTGVAWDPELQEVMTVDEGGKILAVDADSGTSSPVTFTGPTESVQGLSMSDGLLYIGDIGDPGRSRDLVTVFRVDPASDVTTYRAWDFRYPGGPRDAKALALSGEGRIHIVTDGDNPGIYRAEDRPSRTAVNTLIRAADAPEGVTDAVFLDDGSTLMLRTSTGVELLDGYSWESTAATTYVDASAAESLTTHGENRMLVGDGTYLRDEPIPDGEMVVTPGPAEEPTRSQSPSPSPGESSDPQPEVPNGVAAQNGEEEGVSRRGTILALVGAGIVAILAGVVVFLVRD